MIKTTGQEKLLEQLNKYTLATLPKTLLFLGDKGCGKHTFINNLCERLSLDKHIITTKITPEQLIEFSQRPVPTAYIIDLTDFTEKQQNQFLKFIENVNE